MKPAPIVKRKIINDPVHGFINIADYPLYELIEHPFFQRLRRIKQLGLTYFVYPGATHTRFQHALGATYLMKSAIEVLRGKGHRITKEEEDAAIVAILLHDIGHGPFSHALEFNIAENIHHEKLSHLMMEKLNKEFHRNLDLALQIFTNRYKKSFLNQLVTGQLDMDRMDYLKRDSFFTGVSEGVIGSDRIIKMLNVVDDHLVVEEKGIYSVEKFLIARRLMYWQVYLHKTVVAAESLLVNIWKRAKYLSFRKKPVYLPPTLKYFFEREIVPEVIDTNETQKDELIKHFARLDDNDIMVAIKEWQYHEDKVLSSLSRRFINRDLLKIQLHKAEIDKEKLEKARKYYAEKHDMNISDTEYFIFEEAISNNTYSPTGENILILMKSGKLKDISEASDMMDVSVLSREVKKYYVCYPKEVESFIN